jgi:leader peptidase (prepilin peptidase)/N-methyltransferase
MGWGDVKLVFLMGLILGWPQILVALFIAFFIGAVVGLALILISGHRKSLRFKVSKKYTLKSQIPFGPFLIFGTLAALFFGEKIINFYTGPFW